MTLRWLGGVLFVASLACTAWVFVVVFGHLRPFGGWRTAAIDAGLFTIFAAHHSAFARQNVKRALARTIPESAFRTMYVWTSSLLLIGVLFAWQLIGGVVYRVDSPWSGALRGLQLAGVALVAWSVRAIDALELAGIRDAGRSTLQRRGPYAIVRHPVYLGWFLMVCAAPVMTGDRAAFAIISSAYLMMAVPWEERALRQTFGDAYGDYARRVRWRILPRIY